MSGWEPACNSSHTGDGRREHDGTRIAACAAKLAIAKELGGFDPVNDVVWIALGVAAAILVGVLAGWGLIVEFAQVFGDISTIHGGLCLAFAIGVGYLVFRGWISLAPEKMSNRVNALSGSAGRLHSSDPGKPAEIVYLKPMEKATAMPGTKEVVTLRIGQDVLDFFHKAGRGCQDRTNAALRKAAGMGND